MGLRLGLGWGASWCGLWLWVPWSGRENGTPGVGQTWCKTITASNRAVNLRIFFNDNLLTFNNNQTFLLWFEPSPHPGVNQCQAYYFPFLNNWITKCSHDTLGKWLYYAKYMSVKMCQLKALVVSKRFANFQLNKIPWVGNLVTHTYKWKLTSFILHILPALV